MFSVHWILPHGSVEQNLDDEPAIDILKRMRK